MLVKPLPGAFTGELLRLLLFDQRRALLVKVFRLNLLLCRFFLHHVQVLLPFQLLGELCLPQGNMAAQMLVATMLPTIVFYLLQPQPRLFLLAL